MAENAHAAADTQQHGDAIGPRTSRILDTTGAVLLVVTAAAYAYLWTARPAPRPTVRGLTIMTLSAKWTDADGTEHVVQTTQGDSESLADLIARHQAAVSALQAVYPPAGG